MSHEEATRGLVQDVTDNAEKLGKKQEKDKMSKMSKKTSNPICLTT